MSEIQTDQVSISIEACAPEELDYPTSAVRWWVEEDTPMPQVRIEGSRADVLAFIASGWGPETISDVGGPESFIALHAGEYDWASVWEFFARQPASGPDVGADLFARLVEEEWRILTNGELEIADPGEVGLSDLVRSMRASAHEYLRLTWKDGGPVVTNGDVARRVADALCALWLGTSDS